VLTAQEWEASNISYSAIDAQHGTSNSRRHSDTRSKVKVMRDFTTVNPECAT